MHGALCRGVCGGGLPRVGFDGRPDGEAHDGYGDGPADGGGGRTAAAASGASESFAIAMAVAL